MEGRQPYLLCSPCDPTFREVNDHQVTAHLPFRNWCKICIDSKGKSRDHKRLTEEEKAAEENALPRFGLDYGFFSEELELEGSEAKSANSIKVAIMKEKRCGWCNSHLAQRKGGGDEARTHRSAGSELQAGAGVVDPSTVDYIIIIMHSWQCAVDGAS